MHREAVDDADDIAGRKPLSNLGAAKCAAGEVAEWLKGPLDAAHGDKPCRRFESFPSPPLLRELAPVATQADRGTICRQVPVGHRRRGAGVRYFIDGSEVDVAMMGALVFLRL